MDYDQDPTRLSDRAAGAPEEVRELIERAKEDVPSSHQVEKVALALAPLLWPSATAAGAAGAGVGATAAKIVAAVVVTGAVVGTGVWMATGSSGPGDAAKPAPAVLPQPAPPQTRVMPADEAVPAEPSAEPEELGADEDESAAKAQPAAGPSEAQLLQAAQAALRSNPAQALALTREHQRRFPGGVLVQEREVIAIEALSRLGRDREARGRADEFKQQYPGSAHDRKVDTITDR